MGWLSWLIIEPCPLCQRPAKGGKGCFCPDCAQQLRRLRYRHWPAADTQVPFPIYAWGLYQDPLRRALQQLKYDHQRRIGETLGEWLAQRWEQGNQGRGKSLTVVPIPVHAERLKERGYNQAEVISDAFTAATGLRHQPQVLHRVRQTQAQYALTMAQRRDNLRQAFYLSTKPKTPVLILDDIYTTGATIQSAAAILQSKGVEVVGAVVVAISVLKSD